MPRLLPLSALLALGLSTAALSASVQPVWALKNVRFLGFTDRGEVVTRAFYPGGGEASSLERRDPRTGESRGVVIFPEAGNNLGLLAFTPDLKVNAWLNRAGDVLTVRTPERRWSASTPGLDGTRSLTLSPDGRTLAALNVNGYVQLWDVGKGERRATLLLHSQPRSLAFHPTQPLVAVNETWSDSGSVTLWDTETGRKVLTAPGFTGTVRPFQFAPDGSLLTGAGYSVGLLSLSLDEGGQGDRLLNWGLSRRTLPTYTESCPPGIGVKLCARGVWGASFNADGSRVLLNIARTAQNVPASLLYDTKTGRLLGVIDTPGAGAVLTPDGRGLILNTFQGELQGAPLP